MKFVITGGPGFGKTSIINELRNRGSWGGPELLDDFILHQIAIGGDALPWANRDKFEDQTLPLRVEQYIGAPLTAGLAFFDRGFPDHVAYCRKDGIEPHANWLAAIEKYPYDGVFLVPPWPEIHRQDEVRREPYDEAVSIHGYIAQAYRDFGHEPIDIPTGPIEARADFVLSAIASRFTDQ